MDWWQQPLCVFLIYIPHTNVYKFVCSFWSICLSVVAGISFSIQVEYFQDMSRVWFIIRDNWMVTTDISLFLFAFLPSCFVVKLSIDEFSSGSKDGGYVWTQNKQKRNNAILTKPIWILNLISFSLFSGEHICSYCCFFLIVSTWLFGIFELDNILWNLCGVPLVSLLANSETWSSHYEFRNLSCISM